MRRGFLNRPGPFGSSKKADDEDLCSSMSKAAIGEYLPKSNSDAPTREPTVPSSQQKSKERNTKPRSLGWPIDTPRTAAQVESVDEFVAVYAKAGSPGLAIRGCRHPDASPTDPAFCAWLSFSDVYSKIPNIGWKKLLSTPSSVPYRILPVNGAGLGMVATRAIYAGETINIERPVFISPVALPTYDNLEDSLQDIYKIAMGVLDPRTVAAIMSLSNCKPVTKHPISKLRGIIDTNTLYCSFPQSEYLPHYGGVFLDMSRCNHSCIPNATWDWDHCSLSMQLRALQPIREGEEITLSYLGHWQSRSERQRELKTKYDFTCTCPACEPAVSTETQTIASSDSTTKSKSTTPLSEKRAAIAASDSRRKIIINSKILADALWKNWATPTSTQPSTKLIEFHERILQLRAEEGYHHDSEDNYAYLAHACAALGDEQGFKRWAKKLMEWRAWGPGQTGADRRMTWKRWVEDPTTSPAWGLRGTGTN
ncbi:SET domain-containing protein [Rickenella mellea]|uniref:SET domain-containing protein n=1 Tax=Rickenella mellea TaxID=50990 RepID=A0A4Y7PQV5_9AGAM|nr:SET domain-containing protein [Rickenella mellea]